MISYELAKELKEAGFEQQLYGEGPGTIKTPSNGYWTPDHATEEYAYAPTLSELIEACGDDFGNLGQYKFPSDTGAWLATEQVNFYTQRNRKREGETPEEAVARLWLSLNKK